MTHEEWAAACGRWGFALTIAVVLAWGCAWMAYGPSGPSAFVVQLAVAYLIGAGVAIWLRKQMAKWGDGR